MTTRVLGVDPSIRKTGMAWRTTTTGELATTTLHRPSIGVDTPDHWIARAARRRSISSDIVGMALRLRVGLVAIEGAYVAHGDVNELDKLALHGVIHDDLIAARIPFVVIPPSSLKWFFTASNASKKVMVEHAQRLLGMDGKDEDQADGAACMAAGEAATGGGSVQWPDQQLAYLAGASWPSAVATIEFPAKVTKSKAKAAA